MPKILIGSFRYRFIAPYRASAVTVHGSPRSGAILDRKSSVDRDMHPAIVPDGCFVPKPNFLCAEKECFHSLSAPPPNTPACGIVGGTSYKQTVASSFGHSEDAGMKKPVRRMQRPMLTPENQARAYKNQLYRHSFKKPACRTTNQRRSPKMRVL